VHPRDKDLLVMRPVEDADLAAGGQPAGVPSTGPRILTAEASEQERSGEAVRL